MKEMVTQYSCLKNSRTRGAWWSWNKKLDTTKNIYFYFLLICQNYLTVLSQ